MKRIGPCLALAAALSVCPAPEALADGFPGKGDRLEWGYALPYYNLANKYLERQSYDQAIEKYNEAISRYAYDPDFYINLGVALRGKGDFAGAEQAFRKAVELNDKDWMAWSNLGNALLKQNKLDATVDAYKKALGCDLPPPEKSALEKDIDDIRKFQKHTARQQSAAAGATAGQASSDAYHTWAGQ